MDRACVIYNEYLEENYKLDTYINNGENIFESSVCKKEENHSLYVKCAGGI